MRIGVDAEWGLAENVAQQTTLFALLNFWMGQQRLMDMGEACL